MTAQEAAVVSAYTGFLLGDFATMHQYVEKIMERPVYTHEMGDQRITGEIRQRAKADFVALQVTDKR